MKDQLVIAMALSNRVRFYIDRTTDLVQDAVDRFDLSHGAGDALGRVLSIGSIMGSMLKSDKEMLTINILGDGPLGSIVVDAYENGNVRGFVANGQLSDEQASWPVSELIGLPGTLTVTKDLSMEDNWSGTVELQNGEIGQDFAYYFTLSEQTPTAVSVGVKIDSDGKVKAAGALVLQMMPDATDTEISICEHVLSGLKPMSTLIEDYDDSSLRQLAEDLFDDTEIMNVRDIAFKCTCSREKTRNVLHTVAPEQLKKMIEEDHGADVNCNFCNTTYHFDGDELREILKEKEQQKAEKTADSEKSDPKEQTENTEKAEDKEQDGHDA